MRPQRLRQLHLDERQRRAEVRHRHREDYDWARALIAEHRLLDKPYGLLFSTVFGKLHPRELAEWIIEDRLPVRFQLQLHKYVWDPAARGV